MSIARRYDVEVLVKGIGLAEGEVLTVPVYAYGPSEAAIQAGIELGGKGRVCERLLAVRPPAEARDPAVDVLKSMHNAALRLVHAAIQKPEPEPEPEA